MGNVTDAIVRLDGRERVVPDLCRSVRYYVAYRGMVRGSAKVLVAGDDNIVRGGTGSSTNQPALRNEDFPAEGFPTQAMTTSFIAFVCAVLRNDELC